ncbi:hypothetical protein AMTRI_Chr09g40840 [Amborella trichopoda]
MAPLLLFFSSMPICQAQLGLGEPKVSCFDFYLHDVLVAEKRMAVTVAKANMKNASAILFGEVVVIDDPLTEGRSSHPRLLLSMFESHHLVFTDGKFKGSTLIVMGRNLVLLKGLKQTYSIDTTLNAILHYNVTVIHY